MDGTPAIQLDCKVVVLSKENTALRLNPCLSHRGVCQPPNSAAVTEDNILHVRSRPVKHYSLG